jgi:hypothetical protein
VGGFGRELHDRDRRDVTDFFLSSFRNVHRSRTPISLENRFGDNIQDRILKKKTTAKSDPIIQILWFSSVWTSSCFKCTPSSSSLQVNLVTYLATGIGFGELLTVFSSTL